MELNLPIARMEHYKSGSQRARVITEPWGAENLYCPACDSPKINSLPTGTQAVDFGCPNCASRYQLKSSANKFGNRVIDGAYAAMHRAITADQTPNMFFLHYKLPQLTVESVLLIPRFAFSLSCVERRNPLSSKAVRAGYVGCYFVLDRIPPDARIPIVQNGRPVSSSQVRRAYNKIHSLESIGVEKRGWTLDVLNAVRSLGKTEFTLPEIYALESSLKKFHPDNRHVQPKIRQQLQLLRDFGFLEFLGNGSYRLS